MSVGDVEIDADFGRIHFVKEVFPLHRGEQKSVPDVFDADIDVEFFSDGSKFFESGNRFVPDAFVSADGDVSDEVYGDADSTPVVQIAPEVYSKLVIGGSHNSAFDKVRELLFQHTQYNESISLSVIPIYYLEPNTRITVHDNDVGVNGDYLVKTISLPLTIGGTSNISATRCIERNS